MFSSLYNSSLNYLDLDLSDFDDYDDFNISKLCNLIQTSDADQISNMIHELCHVSNYWLSKFGFLIQKYRLDYYLKFLEKFKLHTTEGNPIKFPIIECNDTELRLTFNRWSQTHLVWEICFIHNLPYFITVQNDMIDSQGETKQVGVFINENGERGPQWLSASTIIANSEFTLPMMRFWIKGKDQYVDKHFAFHHIDEFIAMALENRFRYHSNLLNKPFETFQEVTTYFLPAIWAENRGFDYHDEHKRDRTQAFAVYSIYENNLNHKELNLDREDRKFFYLMHPGIIIDLELRKRNTSTEFEETDIFEINEEEYISELKSEIFELLLKIIPSDEFTDQNEKDSFILPTDFPFLKFPPEDNNSLIRDLLGLDNSQVLDHLLDFQFSSINLLFNIPYIIRIKEKDNYRLVYPYSESSKHVNTYKTFTNYWLVYISIIYDISWNSNQRITCIFKKGTSEIPLDQICPWNASDECGKISPSRFNYSLERKCAFENISQYMRLELLYDETE